MPFLWVVAQGQKLEEGRRVELARDPFSIGRGSDNDLTIEDEQISRNHAKILRTARGWVLTDNESANGIWVDDKRIENVRLKDGVRVWARRRHADLRPARQGDRRRRARTMRRPPEGGFGAQLPATGRLRRPRGADSSHAADTVCTPPARDAPKPLRAHPPQCPKRPPPHLPAVPSSRQLRLNRLCRVRRSPWAPSAARAPAADGLGRPAGWWSRSSSPRSSSWAAASLIWRLSADGGSAAPGRGSAGGIRPRVPCVAVAPRPPATR